MSSPKNNDFFPNLDDNDLIAFGEYRIIKNSFFRRVLISCAKSLNDSIKSSIRNQANWCFSDKIKLSDKEGKVLNTKIIF